MSAEQADWLVSAELAPDAADPRLAPFYAAAARGALELPRCAGCGLALELEQRVCDGCGGCEVRWAEAERAGIVHASTSVHRREAALIRTDAPYPVLDVELSSGHRLVMTTVERSDRDVEIGTPVQIGFRSIGGVTVPAAFLPEAPPPTLEVHQ